MTDNTWPAEAPRDAHYYTFTGDHDEEDAAEKYRRRHGVDPEWLWEEDSDGLLRLGPEPMRGHRV